ncbi:type II/IV secretion system protein [Candidatus Azambacteria bacterium]|nr:type II/IV secretion system protein [Candidatus Azambacteria bacterium]
MHISEHNLKKIIVGSDVVTSAQFDTAVQEAKRSNRTIDNVLVGRGDITESYLSEILSDYFNVPIVNFNTVPVNDAVLHLLPEVFSRTNRLAVFAVDEKSRVAKVAMADPGDLRAISLIEVKLNMRVEPYFGTPSSMKSVFKEYRKDIFKEFNTIIEESIKEALETGGIKDLNKMAEHVPIITITDGLVEYAVALGASDIHIERLSEKVLVRYRVDGILRDIVQLPKEIDDAIIARIKILSGLQIDVHFAPQDGRFKFKLEDQSVDIRVSVLPTFYGEKVVMRLLRGSIRPLNLSELGLSDRHIAIIDEAIKRTYGMLLVTGPTGSGKTTTLYGILHKLNTPEVNISTIEDPVEYDVERVNQTPVNPKAGITFANGLRSLMRQNPDIIMVGEIRDEETVSISLNAAMTGHLVLSTLHTNDAPTAIPRLIEMGGEAFLVANTLNLIIAQRLVRKICAVCVSSYVAPPEIHESIKKQLAHFGQDASSAHIPSQLYKGKGCGTCSHTGYQGQIGIFEILNITPKVRELIKPGISIAELRATARAEGMHSMFEDGLAKAEAGTTTIEEVFRVIME